MPNSTMVTLPSSRIAESSSSFIFKSEYLNETSNIVFVEMTTSHFQSLQQVTSRYETTRIEESSTLIVSTISNESSLHHHQISSSQISGAEDISSIIMGTAEITNTQQHHSISTTTTAATPSLKIH